MSAHRPRGVLTGALVAFALGVWIAAATCAAPMAAASDATPERTDVSAIAHRDLGTLARPLRTVTPCAASAASDRLVLDTNPLVPPRSDVATARHGLPLYTLFGVYRL